MEVPHYDDDNTLYTGADESRSVNFGPVALFKEAKLTTNSNKHLDKVEKFHTNSILYKLLSTSARTKDLFHGFEIGLKN